MRCCLISPSLCRSSSIPLPPTSNLFRRSRFGAASYRVCAIADGVEEEPQSPYPSSSSSPSALGKDLKKVVNKTAATFAPRASTASKNTALPGTTLYKVFEVQGYASMLVGGVLSFNLLFPSTQPDLWRLMVLLYPSSGNLFLLSGLLILLPSLQCMPAWMAGKNRVEDEIRDWNDSMSFLPWNGSPFSFSVQHIEYSKVRRCSRQTNVNIDCSTRKYGRGILL